MTDKFAGLTYRPGNVGNEWLRSAVGAVRGRWIILLVCALFGGALGAILTSVQSPSYESSAVIYQTPHFGDTDGTSRQRTEAYTKLLSSDFLIETALANTGLEMSNSAVREMTTASANVGSAILTVTVRAEDADTSAELANALAQALPGAVAVLDGSTLTPDQAVEHRKIRHTSTDDGVSTKYSPSSVQHLMVSYPRVTSLVWLLVAPSSPPADDSKQRLRRVRTARTNNASSNIR